MSSKTVLVTGSSRGIGRATAIQLAESNRNIIINYANSAAKAEEVVEEIRESSGNAISIQCDVSDPDAVSEMAKEIHEEFGTVDSLVNNAGMITRPGHWEELSMEDWQQTLAVNLTGAFNCIREFAPDMVSQGDGTIVSVSSTYAYMGAPVVAYTAAKAGVLNLTKSFARELAPEVNVNAVAPGTVDTDMTQSAGQEFIDQVIDETPLNRLGSPADIAATIEFLLSEKADFITGETIIVDGGHRL